MRTGNWIAAAADDNVLTRRWLEEFGGLLGLRVSDLVGQEGIANRDLIPSTFPETHETDTLYAGLGIDTYFDWGIVNASDTPITVPTTTCITLDGNPALSQVTTSYAANHLETFEDYAYAVPEPGTFTLTVIADCTNAVAESDETDNTYQATFTWNPYISLIISDEHGFDKCDIATTSQMNTWWSDSPYFYANIYLGGIARA